LKPEYGGGVGSTSCWGFKEGGTEPLGLNILLGGVNGGVKGGVERDGCRTLGDRGLGLGRVSKTHKSRKVSKA
jgi:hypothetical protein